MVVAVSPEDAGGDSGGNGDGIREAAVYLVEAFVDVDCPPGEGDALGFEVFNKNCRLVPAIRGS